MTKALFFLKSRLLGKCAQAGTRSKIGHRYCQAAGGAGGTRSRGVFGMTCGPVFHRGPQSRHSSNRSDGTVTASVGATGLELFQQCDTEERASRAVALKTTGRRLGAVPGEANRNLPGCRRRRVVCLLLAPSDRKLQIINGSSCCIARYLRTVVVGSRCSSSALRTAPRITQTEGAL